MSDSEQSDNCKATSLKFNCDVLQCQLCCHVKIDHPITKLGLTKMLEHNQVSHIRKFKACTQKSVSES